MNATIHTLRQPPGDSPFPDDLDLRTIVRQGDRMTQPFHYSDDAWPITGCPDMGATTVSVNFSYIPARWRNAAKDAVLIRTTPSLQAAYATGRIPLRPPANLTAGRSWNGAQSLISALHVVLPAMVQRGLIAPDAHDWAEITAAVLAPDRPLASGGTAAHPASPITAHKAAVFTRMVHDTAIALGRPAPFPTRPWGDDELAHLFGNHPTLSDDRRNVTEPVGDCFAWLGAAQRFVDLAADDIVARLGYWTSKDTGVRTQNYSAAQMRAGMTAWDQLGLPVPHNARLGSTTVRWDAVVAVVGVLHGKPPPIYGDFETWAAGSVPMCDVPDPYDVVHHTSRPTWLPADATLLPVTPVTGDGLWWWADGLVCALYFLMAGYTAQRPGGLAAMPADPLYVDDSGRPRLRGRKVKGEDVIDPPEITWPATTQTRRLVDIVQRLRAAYGRKPELHDRIPDHLVLFSTNLLSKRNPGAGNLRHVQLQEVISSRVVSRSAVPALRRLGHAGVVPPVDDLKLVNHRTLNQTTLSVAAYRTNGDLAAHAFRRWSNVNVGMGYYGDIPRLVTVADPDHLAEFLTENGDLTDVVRHVIDGGDGLSGGGVDMVRTMIEQEPTIIGPVSPRTLARHLANGALSSLAAGPFNYCAAPGGKCGNDVAAAFHQCHVDCGHRFEDPLTRARNELNRRRWRLTLGDRSLPVAKFDAHADQFEVERAMTDDELVDVIVDPWPIKFRVMFRDELLPRPIDRS